MVMKRKHLNLPVALCVLFVFVLCAGAAMAKSTLHMGIDRDTVKVGESIMVSWQAENLPEGVQVELEVIAREADGGSFTIYKGFQDQASGSHEIPILSGDADDLLVQVRAVRTATAEVLMTAQETVKVDDESVDVAFSTPSSLTPGADFSCTVTVTGSGKVAIASADVEYLLIRSDEAGNPLYYSYGYADLGGLTLGQPLTFQAKAPTEGEGCAIWLYLHFVGQEGAEPRAYYSGIIPLQGGQQQQDLQPSQQINDFVIRCYQLFFGRTPSEGEYAGWSGLLASKKASASQIISGFSRSPEFTAQSPSNGDVVEVLYRTMMNRPSDAEGKAAWTGFLDNGCSDSMVINGFCSSAEFAAVCAEYGIDAGQVAPEPRDVNPDVTAFVNRCYQESLGRAGEPDGLNAWCGILLEKGMTPQQVAKGFVFSAEMNNRNLSNADFVTVLYRLYMGREPAGGEEQGWVGLLEGGMSKEEVNNGFAQSPEFAIIVSGYGL